MCEWESGRAEKKSFPQLRLLRKLQPFFILKIRLLYHSLHQHCFCFNCCCSFFQRATVQNIATDA